MLFMLRIEVTIPHDMSDADKDALRAREHHVSTGLIQNGTLLRIWRIVGRIANFSLWQAASLEDLHATLAALPMFPFMKIDVTPLIDHPMTGVADAARAAEVTR